VRTVYTQGRRQRLERALANSSWRGLVLCSPSAASRCTEMGVCRPGTVVRAIAAFVCACGLIGGFSRGAARWALGMTGTAVVCIIRAACRPLSPLLERRTIPRLRRTRTSAQEERMPDLFAGAPRLMSGPARTGYQRRAIACPHSQLNRAMGGLAGSCGFVSSPISRIGLPQVKHCGFTKCG
jgi:hypothetical protein